MSSSKVFDDTDPLVEYDKPELWTVSRGWEGSGVTSGTLHITDLYEVAASMNFNGGGIALTGLLNPSGSNFTIMLDGVLSGPYSLHADSDAQSKVATVYSRIGLRDGPHTIVVRKVPDDPLWQGPVPGQKSFVNIDTFVVTINNPQVTMTGTGTMSPPASSGAPSSSGTPPTTVPVDPTLSSGPAASSPAPTARPRNATVDDSSTLLSWDDPSSWEVESGLGSYGLSGGTLHIQHDYNKAVTIWFKGRAIYMQSLMWWTGCNFTVSLDGELSGPYNLLTLDPLKIQPSIVYSARDLDADQSHVLVVRKIPDDPGYVSRLPDEPTSQLNIDAFFITGGSAISSPNVPDTNVPAAQVPSPGAIAGGIVGGVALIALLAAAFLWHRRRRIHAPRKSGSPTDVLAYQFFPPPGSSTVGSIKDPVTPTSVVVHDEMSSASSGPLAIRPFVLPTHSLPPPTNPSTSSAIPQPGNRKERIVLQPSPPSPTTVPSPPSPLTSDPSTQRAIILETPAVPNRKGRRRDGSLSSPTSTQPSDFTRLSHATESHSNSTTLPSPTVPTSHDDLRGEIEDLRRELRILQSPNGTADVPPPSYDRARAAS